MKTMKKYLSLLLVTVTVLLLSACGGQSPTNNSGTQPKVSYDRSDPESILDAMTSEFDTASQAITDDSATTLKRIGESYNTYSNNKTAVADFYDDSLKTAETLYSSIKAISTDYFKYVAAQCLDDYKTWDNAMEDFYDAWDDNMDDFYKVWDRIYDDIYDKCDDLIEDASDSLKYDEYSDMWSEMYSTYSDAWTAMYSAYSDAWSNTYRDYSAVWSGFYSDETDVDAILEAAAKNSDKDDKNGQEHDPNNSESQPSADARPVDNNMHESGSFSYRIYDDNTIEITHYSGNETTVTISSEIDGYDVSRIGTSAFENCTTIESVVLWPDVISIGDAAFKGCTNLTKFSIPSTVTVITDSVFEDCISLESISIWGDVTSIGEAAFKNCISLTSVSIPSSTTMISTSAFEGCRNMESVIFWGGQTIGDYAFKNCSNLTSISIPSEVTAIGDSAFEGCTALESVIIWGDNTTIGANAFGNCPNLDNFPEGAANSTPQPDTTEGSATKTGLRPEFKEAMDSYEAFYDEYCDFMKKYMDNPTDLTLLGEYADMLTRLSDMDEKFKAWEDGDLNDAELKYYLDVINRVNQKLLEVYE